MNPHLAATPVPLAMIERACPIPSLHGRVLLAEDGPHNQRLIGALIEATGATLTVVENGRQAVDAAMAGGFSLVLMDLHMPVMDGLTATRLLREAGCTAPIAALTERPIAASLRRHPTADFADVLGKPIDRRRLHAVLTGCLGDDEGRSAPVGQHPTLNSPAAQASARRLRGWHHARR